jgi:3-deoxy-manno-octulosonate cytidylyltransferase (CMP-KDO synthetase)
MNNEHIIAIIPARYSSTRLPGKPLIDLGGKPMIQHVYERTRYAKLVNRVMVATDDQRIVDAVTRFGGEAVMTPSDLRSGSDRVAYVARQFGSASIIVNVQGDEPLIEPAMIDEAIKPLVNDPEIRAGTLVRHSKSVEEFVNPNVVKVVLDRHGNALYFSRAPIPFHRDGREFNGFYKHIGLYVYRQEFLLQLTTLPEMDLERTEKLEQLRIVHHGFPIKAVVTEHDSIPVDTPEDVMRVTNFLEREQVSAS